MKPSPRMFRGGPPFLLVTGGKGGVGKTTVAANLGVELGKLQRDPLVCDLDFALANLDVMLGVSTDHTVEDFLTGEKELEECILKTRFGMSVLPAGSGSYQMSQPNPRRRTRLREALSRRDTGIIVGDSPAGIGDDVLEFGVTADRVLVVTTPEPAAVTDAYGVIKAIDSFAADQGVEVPTPDVFVNLATDASEARSIAGKLAGVCERFLARSPRLVGWMPRSGAVLKGVIDQIPFVTRDPRSPAAKSLARLARRYASLSPLVSPAGGVEKTSKASHGLGR